ncbi:MAG: cadherin-like domain-containing protein [Microthrixaceae bacterium]|nr:cadherin-like domain-containing protein [Microthrixaceae bacterium]
MNRRKSFAVVVGAIAGCVVLIAGPSAGARVTLHQGQFSVVFSPPRFTEDPADPSAMCPDLIRGRIGSQNPPFETSTSATLYKYSPGPLTDGDGTVARPVIGTGGKLHYPLRDASGDFVDPPEPGDEVPVVAEIPVGTPTPRTAGETYWGTALVNQSAPFEARPSGLVVGDTLWLTTGPSAEAQHPIVVVACTPPQANPLAISTARQAPVPLVLTGADPEGDALAFEVTAQPTSGALSGTAPNLTYTPTAGFSGSDQFTFTVSDGIYTSPPATVTITVGPADPGGDTVDVQIRGAYTYRTSGEVAGAGFTVTRDRLGVRAIKGGGRFGPSANLSVDVVRIRNRNVGVVRISDPAAGVPRLTAFVVAGPPIGPIAPVRIDAWGVTFERRHPRLFSVSVAITETR